MRVEPSAASPLIKPSIVQAADAVAYLPLYVAEENKPALDRGKLSPLEWDDAFGPTYQMPPEEFLDNVAARSQHRGDIACLHAVKKAWEVKKTPLIGICDPIEISRLGYENDLAIVAGFIRRACFWCLTDEASHASSLEKLSVNDLFIHDASFSTGHAIGDKIAEGMPHADIVSGSFELLVDGAVWLKSAQSNRRIAAISASILSCVLATRKKFSVSFPLYKHQDYSEFLSTAIVVPRTCLKNPEFRSSVVLLVLSINEAIRQLETSRTKGPKIIYNLVNGDGRFPAERIIDAAHVEDNKVVPLKKATPPDGNAPLPASLANISEKEAENIYRELVSSDLYARDGEITGRQWRNAWKARDRRDPPRLERAVDRCILNGARKARLVNQPRTGLTLLPVWLMVSGLLIPAALFALLDSKFAHPVHVTITAALIWGLMAFLLSSGRGVRFVDRVVYGQHARTIVVLLALIVGYAAALTIIASSVVAVIALNDDWVKPEAVANWPKSLGRLWLAIAPKMKEGQHAISYIGAFMIIPIAWTLAGLTPFGRRARRLFGLLSEKERRDDE